jgi:hypothetical protein
MILETKIKHLFIIFMNCLSLFFGLHFTTELRSRNSLSRVHFVSIDENLNNYLMAVLCRTPQQVAGF